MRSRQKRTVAEADSVDNNDNRSTIKHMTNSKHKHALERNRIAASKCRHKKKAHSQLLEARAKRLHEKRENLISKIRTLQEELFVLKRHYLQHISATATAFGTISSARCAPSYLRKFRALLHFETLISQGREAVEPISSPLWESFYKS
jgi:hypothetical protein